jgi:hypothetical protein
MRRIKKDATVAQIRSKAKWHLARFRMDGLPVNKHLRTKVRTFNPEFGEWPVDIFNLSDIRPVHVRKKAPVAAMYFSRTGALLRKPEFAD